MISHVKVTCLFSGQNIITDSLTSDHPFHFLVRKGKKGKGMFLYSAVSSPLDRSKRFTLFALPGRPVHSDTNSASHVSILVMQIDSIHVDSKKVHCMFPILKASCTQFFLS